MHLYNLVNTVIIVGMVVQCAGNRRTAMSKTRTVKGVGWDVSAIGNGQFSLLCLVELVKEN